MDITVLEGEANHYKESTFLHVLAFGRIKENSIAKVRIKVEDVEESKLISTCGCSTVEADEENEYIVQYTSTHLVKPFAKILTLEYVEKGVKNTKNIKLTGTVIK